MGERKSCEEDAERMRVKGVKMRRAMIGGRGERRETVRKRETIEQEVCGERRERGRFLCE